ncbi:hypothetical protein [Nonomuraea sp. NPDC050310]|uniref:hypothetical protein n=1 Tax=Nonomuraea sp. NPDC050310 TaxID=3154935 RepID=UPI0033C5E1C5
MNPNLFPELRAVGEVVSESSTEGHLKDNFYIEFVTIVTHIDGAGVDVAEEAADRLGPSGWCVWDALDQGIKLQSPKWPGAFVTVEQLGVSQNTDQDLREAAATSGLPVGELVSITIQ